MSSFFFNPSFVCIIVWQGSQTCLLCFLHFCFHSLPPSSQNVNTISLFSLSNLPQFTCKRQFSKISATSNSLSPADTSCSPLSAIQSNCFRFPASLVILLHFMRKRLMWKHNEMSDGLCTTAPVLLSVNKLYELKQVFESQLFKVVLQGHLCNC